MKLSFAQDRLLAVMAHPDDAELLCAGTLARAKTDGAAIAICVMCAGDKGMSRSEKTTNLTDVRRAEVIDAAKLIAADTFFCGVPDGELADAVPARRALIEVYRQFEPTLVLAHAATDYHPDHRAASALAEAASWFAASGGHVTGDLPPLDAPPSLWWADTVNMSGFEPGFFIDVSRELDTKKRMLGCHKSQLARGADPDFAPLMDLMLRQTGLRGLGAGVLAAEAFQTHNVLKRARAW